VAYRGMSVRRESKQAESPKTVRSSDGLAGHESQLCHSLFSLCSIAEKGDFTQLHVFVEQH
jgi:hypothetical protein